MKVTFSGSYCDACFFAKPAPGVLRSLAKAAGFMWSALIFARVFLCMHDDESRTWLRGAVSGGRTRGAKATRRQFLPDMNFKHLVQVPSTSTRLIVSRHVATSYFTGLE